MKDKLFADIKLTPESNKLISDAVSSLVQESDLYYSDVAEHIRGSMTNNLHLTLYFGLSLDKINDDELNSLLDGTEITTRSPIGINFFEGYQNLYKVLYLKIDDESKALEDLSKKISEFAPEREYDVSSFKPHITLAYVKNELEIEPNIPVDIGPLQIESIKLTKYSDFIESVNLALQQKNKI